MKSKIRILAISSSGKTGGGPSHIFLLKELLDGEFDFYLAMPNLFIKGYDLNLKKIIEISERKISLKDLYNLIFFARKNSIDIIHSHGKGASLIGRFISIFLKKPLIHTFHGIHVDCLNSFNKFIYIFYENLTGWLDSEKIFVSVSEFNQARKLKINLGGSYSIVNNAVKIMAIKNKSYVNQNFKIGIENHKKNIISICRLVDQKNIFEIFKIAKNLPIYNFVILGDGYLFERSIQYINQNNINNVFLLGNKKNIFKYLYNADLFLSTSLYEGHPISILEAMSIGLPVVASKVTGNCDTITHNHSGYFYDLGDIDDATDKIKNIMSNEKLRDYFAINSYNKQREFFNITKTRKTYLSIYEKHRLTR